MDTTALPVKHPSRVRGADGWTGPGNDLAARFGRDAAHAEWFYGFRLAIKTDLGSRIVRAWSIVPAAVTSATSPSTCCRPGRPRVTCSRTRASAAGASPPRWPPAVPPCSSRPPKSSAPHAPALLKVIAEWRNRIETTFSEITDQMELARHGAHTFWGLLTRTAATIAAHTLMRICLTEA